MTSVSRRSFLIAAGAAGAFGAFSLSACGQDGSQSQAAASGQSASGNASSAASGAASGAASDAAQGAVRVSVGTLATEDILPLWVAEDQGLFARDGLEVEIVQFQSATELIAGVGSGEVDLAMTDIMVAASMFASGIDLQMEWVTLGATPEQGRFGVMVGPASDVQSLEELSGVPIGVGSNTILEYVTDRLMEAAGIPDDQIIVEELQKLPVRYQTMLSGEVAAAALPGSLLALGEANGCRTIADDATGDNISQSVMIARTGFHDSADGLKAIEELEAVWDEAAALINANPEAYRDVLVRNANLSDEVADVYPISEYPECALPTEAMVTPVLEWMEQKGYLTKPLAYDESTGAFA